MATKRNSWIRSYIESRLVPAGSEPVLIVLRLVEGELDGQTISARLWEFPPPEKLYAGDLNPSAVGSYIFDGEDRNGQFVYRCRIDNDYLRLRNNKARIAVAAAREVAKKRK